jgi:hypothetical protein
MSACMEEVATLDDRVTSSSSSRHDSHNPAATPRASTPPTAGRYNRLALDNSRIRFAGPPFGTRRLGY